jgi:hypothetical protein
MSLGYTVNIEKVAQYQDFTPDQVVQCELVFPNGAVPNSQLIWFRVELTNDRKKFVTLPLRDFYEYIDLPTSSIGGWTDGEMGAEGSGLNERYEIVSSALEIEENQGNNNEDSLSVNLSESDSIGVCNTTR